ncbi:MAG TPA: N,N-dimethylformamidase beta subunit family domain-containing protein, partial [Hyphomicrobiaceae bacterium]|nr:N,N-dimethylformamidase beta subunit family domain-containing protein [Hyphomicrobiaceae bacterium]
MIPLAGYADKLSARPGETIAFSVANATTQPVSAKMVRVICADPNPAGPGILTEPLAAELVARTKPEAWPVNSGSYATADLPPFAGSLTCLATIWPSLTKPGHRQTVMSREGAFDFGIDGEGRLSVTVMLPGGIIETVTVRQRLPLHKWARVWFVSDIQTKSLQAGWAPQAMPDQVRHDEKNVALLAGSSAPAHLLIAAGADGGSVTHHFNGRIERPMLLAGALPNEQLAAVFAGEAAPDVIAEWDFSKAMDSSRIVDLGPHACHGTLINTPTRAVRGASWTGREMSWQHAPHEYAAIHFHEDDIDDCHWPVAYEWTIPEGTRSSQYALMLEAGGHTENIPVFVVPPKGKPRADIAVLVSTFTYTIYGNHARPEWMMSSKWRGAWREQADKWKSYPHNPAEHPEYGWSTYNTHTDGSGIAIASWHRPMFNLRVGYLTYPFPDIRASGLRHYPADSHLTAWLEAKGYDYDIITDWELHNEGADVLKPYRVVMTGTHPEYHTRQTLDALKTYRDAGGRFTYLGGNGFYWKVALGPEKDGVIEIRRGEGGIRAWAAEPGEYYNQFDGEYGGLWRRNGRPPQDLSGVGFTAQGNFVGSHYRVHDDARASRAAWILDGITGETLGGHGLSGHGAAGFELDRADKALGTPEH